MVSVLLELVIFGQVVRTVVCIRTFPIRDIGLPFMMPVLHLQLYHGITLQVLQAALTLFRLLTIEAAIRRSAVPSHNCHQAQNHRYTQQKQAF